jgi:hypothetical protein
MPRPTEHADSAGQKGRCVLVISLSTACRSRVLCGRVTVVPGEAIQEAGVPSGAGSGYKERGHAVRQRYQA